MPSMEKKNNKTGFNENFRNTTNELRINNIFFKHKATFENT